MDDLHPTAYRMLMEKDSDTMKRYDLIIVGSGPAGLSAAIYAQRAKLDTLVVEKAMVSGGQVLTTYEVDNYPGLPGMGGYDLGTVSYTHLRPETPRGHCGRAGYGAGGADFG